MHGEHFGCQPEGSVNRFSNRFTLRTDGVMLSATGSRGLRVQRAAQRNVSLVATLGSGRCQLLECSHQLDKRAFRCRRRNNAHFMFAYHHGRVQSNMATRHNANGSCLSFRSASPICEHFRRAMHAEDHRNALQICILREQSIAMQHAILLHDQLCENEFQVSTLSFVNSFHSMLLLIQSVRVRRQCSYARKRCRA